MQSKIRSSAQTKAKDEIQKVSSSSALFGNQLVDITWPWETQDCSCDLCESHELAVAPAEEETTFSAAYFACRRKADEKNLALTAEPMCKQTKPAEERVVQNQEEIEVEHFCINTCAPEPKNNPGEVSKCTYFDKELLKKAQTKSENGKAFMWTNSIMTDSHTFANIPPAPPILTAMQSLRKVFQQPSTNAATSSSSSSTKHVLITVHL